MINFVDTLIPVENATTHFCFIGATGSGKTVSIRILMQSVLPVIQSNKVVGINRALIYDAKRDMLPVLHGIVGRDDYDYGKKHKVVTLNPFDSRSYAWKMSEDITDPAHAQELATILFPKEPNATQPFFGNAARQLLQGVITVFILTKKSWRLRDVVCAMKDQDRLIGVLKSNKYTQHLVSNLLHHPETSKNIMSEIASRMSPYEVIAALWHEAEKEEREISLNEWVSGDRDFILVLGCEHTNRAAIDAINQVIFKRISELILDLDDAEDGKPKIWIFLDEFVRAGKLDGIVELATEGRSKGAAIVLGFQDINGARAVYGKEVAEEIVGQCSNIAILRLQSPDTAEWASRLFGKYEIPETKITRNRGYTGSQESSGASWVTDLVQRESVLASEFMYMPPTNKKNGLSGIRYVPGIGRIDFPIEGTKVFGKESANGEWSGGLLWPKFKEKGMIKRKSQLQFLNDWELKDFERLGLTSLMQQEGFAVKAQEVEKLVDRLNKLAQRAFYFAGTNDDFLTQELEKLQENEKALFKRFLLEIEERYPQQGKGGNAPSDNPLRRNSPRNAKDSDQEKKRQAMRELALLWIMRNQTAQELAEVQSWSEDDQQEFYSILQEMSGKPPLYVRPDSKQ